MKFLMRKDLYLDSIWGTNFLGDVCETGTPKEEEDMRADNRTLERMRKQQAGT